MTILETTDGIKSLGFGTDQELNLQEKLSTANQTPYADGKE